MTDLSEVWTLFQTEAQILSPTVCLFTLLLALILGLFIAWSYRSFSFTIFYSKTFNFSLVFIPFVVTVLVISVKTSIAVSLGILGALSVIRYRTPIKEPLDLLFIFWAVAEGVACGAGLFFLALISTSIIILGLRLFNSSFLTLWKPKPYVIILRFNQGNVSQIVPKIKENLASLTLSLREKHLIQEKENFELGLEVIPKKDREDQLMDRLKGVGADHILIISTEGNLISY